MGRTELTVGGTSTDTVFVPELDTYTSPLAASATTEEGLLPTLAVAMLVLVAVDIAVTELEHWLGV